MLATGIDIENKKITFTANKFECQNNSGVKTAWLDNLGNFTTTGVMNNLITVIDWDNNKGRELIITTYTIEGTQTVLFSVPDGGEWYYYGGWYYSVNGNTYKVSWWLDVLRCGDFVSIKSLPKYGGQSQEVQYNLPYYATSTYQARGYTKFRTGEIHKMNGDELRMLVGRRISFKIIGTSIPSGNRYYTHIGHVFDLVPYHHNSWEQGLEYIANGQNFYITPTANDRKYIPCVPMVAHVEFRSTIWTVNQTSGITYEGFGYVWLAAKEMVSPTDNLTDGLDSWTD